MILKELKNRGKPIIFLIVIYLLAQFLTHFPDYYKWINTPSDKWFTGQVSWFDPWDLNVYFSAIGWGSRGSLLFENLYDTSSSKGMFIYIAYTLLGKITAPLHLSNALVFHASSIIFGYFLLLVIWWFISIYLKEGFERVAAMGLLFISGGFGWLFYTRILLPDIGQPGFILESALRRPHETLSTSFFLLSIGHFFQGIIANRKHSFLYGGFFTFLLALFHPYSFLPLGVILLVFASLHWYFNKKSDRLIKTLIYLGISGTCYYLLIARNLLSNSAFSGLLEQVQFSPNPLSVFLGWGLLFPLVLASFKFSKNNKETFFLKVWLISQLIVIYLPFGFQKLLIRGLWFPVVLLSVRGLIDFSNKFRLTPHFLIAILLIIGSFSPLFTTYKRLVEPETNRWIYLTKDEGEIMNYLNQNGDDEEGVLASYRIANMIPANTNKRVWAGHEFQTPHFNDRILEVNRFFTGKMTEEEAGLFLKKTRSKWIFWGPEEKAIGKKEIFPYASLAELKVDKKTAQLYLLR